jgi:pyruvate dehydrogenase E2 component (dihydrolipoamide acetyltransferase)
MAQETGKIVEWLRAEGQHVTAGEPLVVVETDKATVDLEAPATGILARVSARPGDEVPVAQVIAVILSPEEAAAGMRQPHNSPAYVAGPEPAGAPAQEATSMGVATAAASDTSRSQSASQSTNGHHLASPKAKRMAAERGLDLAALRGTGPGGVVLAADVLTAGSSAPAVVVAPPPAPVLPATRATSTAGGGESATSTIWRLMAERTTQSWTTIPHFFLVREVAADALIAWRARAAQEASETVTYTDLLVKLVAAVLRRHPRLNASWQDGAVVHNEEVNVGLAVAIADGLVVPVIHQADDLTLAGIARRRANLVGRAQAGGLRPRDLQDGTFTISNLGMYGVDAFNAIINGQQAAILAVGRVVDRVVPVNGRPEVRPRLTLSLSCDHRVVDGARGAEFLATLAALIENPTALGE